MTQKRLKSLLRLKFYWNTCDSSKASGSPLWGLPIYPVSLASNSSSFLHPQTNSFRSHLRMPCRPPIPTHRSFLCTLMTACFYPKHSTYHTDEASHNLTSEVLNTTSGPETPGHVVISQSYEAWNRIVTAKLESLISQETTPRVHIAAWCYLLWKTKL